MKNWQRLTICIALATSLAALANSPSDEGRSTCPSVKLQVEQLPNLNVARSGHYTFCCGDEVVVIGGHTSGFVPTATAEYYSNGEWHLLPTTYNHDQGFAFQMASGKILIAGGHEQPLGIGQTFPIELYDPSTHAFNGFGCLDKKRCFAQGVELDSGRVYITGNWYTDDAIECFDGSRQCQPVKEVSQPRTTPYFLRTSKDNAIVFSSLNHLGNPYDTIIVDRLHGEPFKVPLFDTWRPSHIHTVPRFALSFIGNEGKGKYAYLLTAVNKDGQLAIIMVEGEHFSLLPTTNPIPMKSQWGQINYFSNVVADRKTGRAYVVGSGDDLNDQRLYVLAIDYLKSPAPLTLYYTEPQDSIRHYCNPVLTAEGNLMMAGGYGMPFSNFEPHGHALLLCVGSTVKTTQNTSNLWCWVLLLLILAAIATIILLLRNRRKSSPKDAKTADSIDNFGISANDKQMMQQICYLMEQEQLFVNKGLKVSDIAAKLGTNSRYISKCIKSERGCTFTQFVNAYRVEFAKQLLQQQPDKKLSIVCTESGFSGESSFFRTFKQLTGVTPKEWMAGK